MHMEEGKTLDMKYRKMGDCLRLRMGHSLQLYGKVLGRQVVISHCYHTLLNVPKGEGLQVNVSGSMASMIGTATLLHDNLKYDNVCTRSLVHSIVESIYKNRQKKLLRNTVISSQFQIRNQTHRKSQIKPFIKKCMYQNVIQLL